MRKTKLKLSTNGKINKRNVNEKIESKNVNKYGVGQCAHCTELSKKLTISIGTGWLLCTSQCNSFEP